MLLLCEASTGRMAVTTQKYYYSFREFYLLVAEDHIFFITQKAYKSDHDNEKIQLLKCFYTCTKL